MERYSFTGNGNILLKANAAGTYGGKAYIAGEPIAYFKDVLIDISFSNSEKIAKQGIANLAADSKSEASFLRVDNIAVSDSLQSLLYKKQINNTRNRVLTKYLTSTGGSMFIPIQDGETVVGSTFIYLKGERDLITTYSINNSTGEITGLANGEYHIFYSIGETSKATYFLDTPTMPNFSAQVEATGNLDGATGTMIIDIKNMKLLTRPSIDLGTANPFVTTLDFAIIASKESVEINYYA